MQNSSEFQYIAIDTIHESATNPRRTFDESKLHELGEPIRTNGLIQPITVRPNSHGFEIVAGARRFRAAQLAELFSLPARIVDINDAQALEWAAGRELAARRRSPLRRSTGLPAAAGHARLRRGNTGREVGQKRSPRLRPSVSAAATVALSRGPTKDVPALLTSKVAPSDLYGRKSLRRERLAATPRRNSRKEQHCTATTSVASSAANGTSPSKTSSSWQELFRCVPANCLKTCADQPGACRASEARARECQRIQTRNPAKSANVSTKNFPCCSTTKQPSESRSPAASS